MEGIIRSAREWEEDEGGDEMNTCTSRVYKVVQSNPKQRCEAASMLVGSKLELEALQVNNQAISHPSKATLALTTFSFATTRLGTPDKQARFSTRSSTHTFLGSGKLLSFCFNRYDEHMFTTCSPKAHYSSLLCAYHSWNPLPPSPPRRLTYGKRNHLPCLAVILSRTGSNHIYCVACKLESLSGP